MKRFKFRDSIIVGAASIVVLLGSTGNAYAAASKAAAKPAAPVVNTAPNTMKISPLRTDVVVKPGESGSVTVTVENITNQAIALKPIENDFVAGDDKGTPAVILDENSYAPTHSLKRFMKPLPNVTVPAKGSQEVKVAITVPTSAAAGGYFGALRFVPADTTNTLNLSVNASVVSLILMTVPGDLQEHLVLQNFDVQQNGGIGNNFRNPDNLSLLVRFKNTGNVQVAPFGQINVLSGKKVLYSVNFNDKDQKDNVLPDSSRRWEVPLKKLGKFGKYTVNGTFTYGTNTQSIEVKKTIWIIPSTYILIAFISLLVIAGLIFMIVMFLKSYKKRILRQSRS